MAYQVGASSHPRGPDTPVFSRSRYRRQSAIPTCGGSRRHRSELAQTGSTRETAATLHHPGQRGAQHQLAPNLHVGNRRRRGAAVRAPHDSSGLRPFTKRYHRSKAHQRKPLVGRSYAPLDSTTSHIIRPLLKFSVSNCVAVSDSYFLASRAGEPTNLKHVVVGSPPGPTGPCRAACSAGVAAHSGQAGQRGIDASR